ncbi:MAG TPA: hypothetical protein VEW26_01305 [Allosphingosinicella sp.]|nr:hypothetical protein [Allosphingosinicella sp.]
MLRRLASLLLAPLLASCQPPGMVVRAGFIGDSLAFVSADSGSGFCWKEAAVVDDRLRPAWRFSGPGTGECRALLPLVYGKAPEGTETGTEAARLEPGRLYLFIGDATAEVSGAFSLTRAGQSTIVHNVDPDSPPAKAIRERWWNSRAAGR